MPSMPVLVAYWREHADEVPSLRSHWIGWGEPFCFACGWLAPVADGPDAWTRATGWLDRAHLQDHWIAGDDSPRNLVPLCHECHEEMPHFVDRDAALAWVASRPDADPLWQSFTDARLHRRTPSRGTTLLRARLHFERILASGGARR